MSLWNVTPLLKFTDSLHDQLNWLHRLAGRLVILAGLLHTVLFLRMAPLHVHEPVHLTGLICAVAS